VRERVWASVPTRFIDEQAFETMLVFPKDMARRTVPRNSLNDQVLVRLFEEEWGRVGRAL